MPMAWVAAAHPTIITVAVPMTACGDRALAISHRTTGRPRSMAQTVISTSMHRGSATDPSVSPLAAVADTTDSSIQPVTSSTTPTAMVSWAMSRCSSRMSYSILAITGKALTHMATPMKKANRARSRSADSRAAGATKPAAQPSPRGISRPKAAHRERRPPGAAHQGEVDLQRGRPHEEDHPDLADRVQQMGLGSLCHVEPVLESGEEPAQHRGTEQDASQQLT